MKFIRTFYKLLFKISVSNTSSMSSFRCSSPLHFSLLSTYTSIEFFRCCFKICRAHLSVPSVYYTIQKISSETRMLESTKAVLLSIGRKMLVRFLLELPTVESMILSSVELRNNEIHTDRRLILKMLKDFESAFREYTSRPLRLPNNENNKHQSLPQLSYNDSLTGAQKLHDSHVWANEHIFVAIAASNEHPKRWPVTGV